MLNKVILFYYLGMKGVPIQEDKRDKFHNGGIPINVPPNALRKLKIQQIPAKAGDLIIWRRELAHGRF